MKGTWIKLDDRMPENAKVVEAGHEAAWLYVCGLAYASRNLTDGRIPKGIVARLSDLPDAATAAKRLCEVGLWKAESGAYVIHDYNDYQRSKDEIEAVRAAGRERQRRHQEAKKAGADRPNLQAVATQLVGEGGVLDAFLKDSDDVTATYLAVLDQAVELGPKCNTTSKDPVGYLQNAVLFRAAKDLHDVEVDKARRLVREAKVLGADGPRWIVSALVSTASADIKGDPISYVIQVARNLSSETKSGRKGARR